MLKTSGQLKQRMNNENLSATNLVKLLQQSNEFFVVAIRNHEQH